MRVIDLDELLKFPIRLDHYDKENGNEHFVYGVESVLEYAENLPVVEAEPVRHGHWIFREEATPEYLPWDMWCSCCGEYHDSDDYNDKYCSKCGAKIDGGTDNG